MYKQGISDIIAEAFIRGNYMFDLANDGGSQAVNTQGLFLGNQILNSGNTGLSGNGKARVIANMFGPRGFGDSAVVDPKRFALNYVPDVTGVDQVLRTLENDVQIG